ncbi:hypothetical protein [Glycomyces arizonensis]|uniref:hypothetical protein n=1 Tax=Glycomyces arizonensis TaxID=256035 RepID=UPI0004261F73|nr:hypothetical protein [Glycomyces arizonensis]
MSSTTIRHSGVLENTQTAAHFAAGHSDHRPRRRGRRYPPGFGPGEPYYEPDHLRHKPGEDWQIGGKPHAPDDPGPYGTPGWYQDTRTGRHRRNELPDPLPGSTFEEEATEEYRFSPMREAAYAAFIRDSEELHRAHHETDEPSRALIRLRWLLRVLIAVLHWRALPFPDRPQTRAEARAIAHSDPAPVTAGTARAGGARPSSVPHGTAFAPQVFFDAVRTARLERHVIGGAAR